MSPDFGCCRQCRPVEGTNHSANHSIQNGAPEPFPNIGGREKYAIALQRSCSLTLITRAAVTLPSLALSINIFDSCPIAFNIEGPTSLYAR